ncbi:HAD-IA family hydrolase [Campylobacter sp. US33a]|uniref:HAD-IA family hydrolase n=1 Tax=Campylobacter sp. US33a TaxID=2498120 RepID=UPI00106771A2|nr:HAD-IA family hydrolase [Campylobacter sp. US33a]TEY03974.1 hypothetical protein ELQ16_01690 [Campylobacter sp. US33a]
MLEQINSKVIFVDFFDTLVFRSTYPENTKKIWAKELNFINERLYELRKEIEKELCEENYKKNGSYEFKYRDMCSRLYAQFSSIISFEDFYRLAQKTELQVEKKVQYPNIALIKELKEYKNNNGAKIYCISDFYFDKNMMLNLVNFHSLDLILDDLFVSSEFMQTKHSGQLYQIVLKNINAKLSDVVMIGDNIYSDIAMANKNNIKTLHINSSKQYDYYEKMKQNEFLTFTQFENILHEIPEYKKFIFPEILLVLYLFVNQISNIVVKKNIRKIFFIAREGEFLKKIFDIYIKNSKYENIKSCYLCVSRKSTFMPSLTELKNETFERLFRQYNNMSIKEFLSNCSFTEKDITTVKSFFPKLNFNLKIDNFNNSIEFNTLKKSKNFQDLFNKINRECKSSLLTYLDGIGFLNNSSLLVDVGWKGTIQDNIACLLKDKRIEGAYLGLVDFGSASDNNQKLGILFNPSNCFNTKCKNSVFNESRCLYELFLEASHGSTIGYKKNSPIFEVNQEEEQNFNNYILPMQNEALVVWEKICKFLYPYYNQEKYLYDIISHKYFEFILNPSNKQIDFFASLKHYENFGEFGFSIFTNKKSSVVKNILNFLKYRKKYLSSAWWKAAKLKQDNLNFILYIYRCYRKYHFKKGNK